MIDLFYLYWILLVNNKFIQIQISFSLLKGVKRIVLANQNNLKTPYVRVTFNMAFSNIMVYKVIFEQYEIKMIK